MLSMREIGRREPGQLDGEAMKNLGLASPNGLRTVLDGAMRQEPPNVELIGAVAGACYARSDALTELAGMDPSSNKEFREVGREALRHLEHLGK